MKDAPKAEQVDKQIKLREETNRILRGAGEVRR
jgi:hypothetical protein